MVFSPEIRIVGIAFIPVPVTKENILTLSLIPYNEKDYELLCREATAEKVKEHLKEIVHRDIVRYELPNIAALQFVYQQALLGVSLHGWQWTPTAKG